MSQPASPPPGQTAPPAAAAAATPACCANTIQAGGLGIRMAPGLPWWAAQRRNQSLAIAAVETTVLARGLVAIAAGSAIPAVAPKSSASPPPPRP